MISHAAQVRLARGVLGSTAFVMLTGCATLGGTTRHFDETSTGPSRILSSQRLPAQDRIEVAAEATVHSATIRAQVIRVLACQVLRDSPQILTRTTTQKANRALFGAEVTLTIVGAIITGAALSSAAKACPNGNPDTCQIGKATGLLAGAVTAPFLVSTVADLALTGGTQRSTRANTMSSVQSEYVEECGREPAPNVQAKLALPDGEVMARTSSTEGTLLFVLTADQVTRLGSSFELELLVEGAAARSISVRLTQE